MTRNIHVVVRPKYLQSQSRPEDDHFVWAYTITIANKGVEIVTLRSRHWRITDDRGKLQEVKGEGVVREHLYSEMHRRGIEIVTLRARHWKITDDRGKVQEVIGDGVVGKQPTLAPGESFEYTSGVPLSTPSGFMVGTYQMETSSGERFDVDIPAFSLDSPQSHRLIN